MLPDNETLVDLFAHIEFNSDTYIEMLRELVRIPSIAATGEGIDEVISKVIYFMEDAGISVELLELPDANPIIFGTIQSTKAKQTLLFYDHYDVQPAHEDEGWDSPPFDLSIRIENEKGRIFGRGVADNKGDLTSRIALVNSFLDTTGDIPINLKFVVEGEEEIGSPNLERYVTKFHKKFMADYGVWEFGEYVDDGVPKIFLGVKGNQYLELRAKGPRIDVHSSKAPIIPNPAWRLLEALRTLRDEQGHILIDKFEEKIIPFSQEELDLIAKIPFDEEAAKRQYGISEFRDQKTGIELLHSLKQDPTCTICGLKSGFIDDEGTKTIIPAYALAKLDIRLVPNQTPQETMDLIHAHLQSRGYQDIEVIDLKGLEPSKTPYTDPFVKIVAESAQATFKKPPIIDPMSEASGPLYLFRNRLKIPFVGIGVAHSFSGAHSPNENITVNGFIDTIKWFGTLLCSLSSQKV